VWPVVVEAMGEGVDEGLQLVDAVGQVEAGVELVAPGALHQFNIIHPTVESMPTCNRAEGRPRSLKPTLGSWRH
jgi:hypothetical protein